MRAGFHLIFLLIAFCEISFSQGNSKKPDTVFCDCITARAVKISGNQKIGETIAPPGFGQVEEKYITRVKTKYGFEKEHHSAWYKLIINITGNLSFDILPSNPDDDYDFVMFKAGNDNFCDSLERYKIKPVRSNISRDKNELKGKTGLSITAKNEFVKDGLNDAYSLSLNVKKGEVYYLVLDNVYENGSGHTINFFFEQKVEIKGVVKSDEGNIGVTQVTLSDAKGETIAETKTDLQTGKYKLNTVFKRGVIYSLNYYNDSSFVFSKTISLKDTLELKNIEVVLPKLRRGKKYSIGAVNFYGSSDQYLPSAFPVIRSLYKLMEKNSNLIILIIGHVNCAHEGKPFGVIGDFTLSIDRAKKIRDYLIRQKIRTTRVETMGVGCEGMLFPKANTEAEEEANRRVEIKVLEY
ncbi:MAG TPA: OmpA family protein [Bacteroidia bacterium]|jgi:outer membrane protein OmpA-like peptidoglycan-associated protein|nr:OmpA family protein [Bacteroidia bacterium]